VRHDNHVVTLCYLVSSTASCHTRLWLTSLPDLSSCWRRFLVIFLCCRLPILFVYNIVATAAQQRRSKRKQWKIKYRFPDALTSPISAITAASSCSSLLLFLLWCCWCRRIVEMCRGGRRAAGGRRRRPPHLFFERRRSCRWSCVRIDENVDELQQTKTSVD